MDDELLEHVADIARQLSREEELDGLLQRVVDLGHEEIENCDGVSMMLVLEGGRVSTPAFSSTVARDSDLAQYTTQQGPCLEAMQSRATVIINDLAEEARWPQYRERALALGVRSMLGVRLFQAQDTMGALDFHSATPHAFGRRAQLYAQVFGAHAAIAIKAAITEAGLSRAVASRDAIGQAKGILMERHGLTPSAAFARLRQLSQEHNRPIRELAEVLVRTGELPG